MFEPRTATGSELYPYSTGSELYPYSTCRRTTTFVSFSIFSLVATTTLKIRGKSLSWHAKYSQYPSAAQKRRVLKLANNPDRLKRLMKIT